jgi:hypothetical protein
MKFGENVKAWKAAPRTNFQTVFGRSTNMVAVQISGVGKALAPHNSFFAFSFNGLGCVPVQK